MKVDLNRASNWHGKLSPEVRKRITALLENPCEETWDDAHGIIVSDESGTGLGLTIWQAVIRVNPDYGRVRGPETDASGNRISGWSEIPSRPVIEQALLYATC